jgi:formylmethanofuran dehydrogenase subunit E
LKREANIKAVESLDEILKECERAHGHLCAGQILGARMAMLGCDLIGIRDPRGADRKKLIVWVEIDRCMADAVGAATGTRLGRRSLKYVDYGKVAATFLNTESGKAVRIAALDEARELADSLYPEMANRKERQMRTYREATLEKLFKIEFVKAKLSEWDEPGRPRSRVKCSDCGEGINDGREVRTNENTILCRTCNGTDRAYYEKEEVVSLEEFAALN